MDAKILHELFEYRDGKLYWKISRPPAKAGDRAGCKHRLGYWRVRVNGKEELEHRVVFAMHNGFVPEQIDHINCNRQDNRIENLRLSNQSENMQNRRIGSNNKSGIKGVCLHKNTGTWSAYCKDGKKRKWLGYYKNIKDAEEAVKKYREKAHGEFCNHG